VWEGYIESYAFPSGSDHVRVVFDSASGDGARTGVVIFGAGTPPPPATDPNVGYPPGVSMPDRFGSPSISEGFEYPIVDGSVTGARVQLTVRLGSLWERWCELQTPIPQTASGTWFSCLPNTGGGYGPSGCYYNDPTSGDPVPVDCGKYALCSMWMVCDCEPAGCVAGSVGEIAFDFHVVGDAGDGSVTIRDLHNVHLTRAP
jgi:hypothetical protein